jgi:hypothetical protein
MPSTAGRLGFPGILPNGEFGTVWGIQTHVVDRIVWNLKEICVHSASVLGMHFGDL